MRKGRVLGLVVLAAVAVAIFLFLFGNPFAEAARREKSRRNNVVLSDLKVLRFAFLELSMDDTASKLRLPKFSSDDATSVADLAYRVSELSGSAGGTDAARIRDLTNRDWVYTVHSPDVGKDWETIPNDEVVVEVVKVKGVVPTFLKLHRSGSITP